MVYISIYQEDKTNNENATFLQKVRLIFNYEENY